MVEGLVTITHAIHDLRKYSSARYVPLDTRIIFSLNRIFTSGRFPGVAACLGLLVAAQRVAVAVLVDRVLVDDMLAVVVTLAFVRVRVDDWVLVWVTRVEQDPSAPHLPPGGQQFLGQQKVPSRQEPEPSAQQ
ncbi:hypothetical protein ACJ73_06329 [Blastomyces percursus]|uniref:Uncharacterized protein n=1 Tax=Blastomyces percursus TaxID=1658174 RepID=A0A1J9R3X9_9EURO|nr:hypothetical protein ACJ73_06329 [Blastomyces percursus]